MKTLRKAEELLFEITVVFVRLDHVARVIVNADHSVMLNGCNAPRSDRIGDGIRPIVPEPTEWQRVGDELKAVGRFTLGQLFDRNISKLGRVVYARCAA